MGLQNDDFELSQNINHQLQEVGKEISNKTMNKLDLLKIQKQKSSAKQ